MRTYQLLYYGLDLIIILTHGLRFIANEIIFFTPPQSLKLLLKIPDISIAMPPRSEISCVHDVIW